MGSLRTASTQPLPGAAFPRTNDATPWRPDVCRAADGRVGPPNSQEETSMSSAPQGSWFGRNWFWVVPVGCLVPLVVCCGGGTLIFYSVSSAVTSTEGFKQAQAEAKANPK